MRIEAIEAGLPSRRVTNDDFTAMVEAMLESKLSVAERQRLQSKIRALLALSGTETRYVRAEGEKALDIALHTGRDALAAAGLAPADVDLLIYTGVARGWLEPAMATVFQAELGLKNATCFDISDACASWMRSLFVAKSLIDGGRYRRVVILNCEMMYWEIYQASSGAATHQHDAWSAGATVGEAATATVLSDRNPGDDFYFSFRTWGEKHDLCKIPLGNYKAFTPGHLDDTHVPMAFSTRSTELIAFTFSKMIEHYRQDRELQRRRHDLLIAHSISAGISAETARRMDLPPKIAFDTHALYGNTVSATMPLALATAAQNGLLPRGTRVLLPMGSSGVTTGLCSFTY